MCGIPVEAILDTGAEVTVMGENLFNSLPSDQFIMGEEQAKSLLVAEEGRIIESKGVVYDQFLLGASKFTWPVHVAPIADNLLLGCDLFHEKNITLNSRQGLQLNGEWISCEVTRNLEPPAKLYTNKEACIQANSEMLITGHVRNKEVVGTRFGAVEPVFVDRRELMIARCVVDHYGNEVPVRPFIF